jgi:predicted GIY-YIG superfamily endonuclease
MFFVYILACSDASYYVGHTHDVARRLEAHAAGIAAAFTRERRPVRLVYCESQPTREAAVRRERQIKGWTRAKKEALIRGDLAGLHSLSRRRRA